jgi:hypothetical protein
LRCTEGQCSVHGPCTEFLESDGLEIVPRLLSRTEDVRLGTPWFEKFVPTFKTIAPNDEVR